MKTWLVFSADVEEKLKIHFLKIFCFVLFGFGEKGMWMDPVKRRPWSLWPRAKNYEENGTAPQNKSMGRVPTLTMV